MPSPPFIPPRSYWPAPDLPYQVILLDHGPRGPQGVQA